MKRVFFSTIAVAAIMTGAILSGCGTKKQATQSTLQNVPTQSSSEDDEIARLRRELELQKLKNEIEKQKMQWDMDMDDFRAEQEERRRNRQRMVKGEQRLVTLCARQAMDSIGITMGGLGIVEERPDRNRAIVDANRAAMIDIATRLTSLVEGSIDDYSKDVNVPSNKKMYQSSFEGGTTVIVQKVVDKYANVVCREITQNSTGSFTGYVAVQMMLQDTKRGLADELEVLKVDYDKAKYFEKLEARLEAMAAQRKADLESGNF